jgi:hypothetical protein
MTSAEAQIFRSIVSKPDPYAYNKNVRSNFRSTGTIATISRIIDGVERHRLGVLVTNRSNDSVCLRSPIGLPPGAMYQLQIGTQESDQTLLQITASRPREDGSYDVGAREMPSVSAYAAAA